MVTDRVGDFIIRLQNAAQVGKQEVVTPYSLHLVAIAKKLKELGFLISVDTSDSPKSFSVVLSYGTNGEARIRGVKRISKPGRRLYSGHSEAHRVKGGTGVRILSSSVGIISDAEARKNRQGGEALFEIW
jgi:small subunit ribosomal protein S8